MKAINIKLMIGILLGFISSVNSFAQNDTAVVFTGKIFILQDFVENFEHGLNAGGNIIPFGADHEFGGLEDGIIGVDGSNNNLFDTDVLQGGNFTYKLETTDTGFTDLFSAIGISKTFAPSTDSSNNVTRSIDASAFNSISYWVRGMSDNPSTTGVDEEDTDSKFVIEFIIDQGGDFRRDANGQAIDENGSILSQAQQTNEKRLPGSTWTQMPRVSASPTFARIVALLDESQFTRTIFKNPNDGNGNCVNTDGVCDFADDVFDDKDLANITAVNIVFTPTSETGKKRTFYIDDINFFNNPRILTVTQDAVFSPADNSSSIVVTATVKDNGNVPTENVNLVFEVIHEDNSSQTFPKTILANDTGQTFITYSVTDLAEIVEIRVKEDTTQ